MATPKGFILFGDLNVTEEDIEFETLCALLGIPKHTLPKLKSEKKHLDYILCGATMSEISFKTHKMEFVFKEKIKGEKIHYSDHDGVSAFIKVAKISSEVITTRQVLKRTLRYMKHSIELIEQMNRWLQWIPYMKPQLTYIQALITMLETDIKEVDSVHPLRLKII